MSHRAELVDWCMHCNRHVEPQEERTRHDDGQHHARCGYLLLRMPDLRDVEVAQASRRDYERLFALAEERFRPGLYRHYKGDHYPGLGLVRDSTDGFAGRPLVLYASGVSGRLNSRPWTHWVEWMPEHQQCRFEFVRDRVED